MPSHLLGPIPGRAPCGAPLGIEPLAGHLGAGETCPACLAEKRCEELREARMYLAESAYTGATT